MINRLRKKLWYLRDSHGIVGVKGGTEVEDMSFEELGFLRDISMDIVPMMVKIGGPEARNDIRQCLKIGVDGILAPMIESEYAFINYTETIKNLAESRLQHLNVAINMETITGYYNINSMICHENFQFIKQITVGRSDLAGSMEFPVNHQEVTNVTVDIVRRAKENGKLTSVGGKIDSISAQEIKEVVKPDRINTRHISIDLSKVKNLTFSVCEALSFEIELYKYFLEVETDKKEAYLKRIDDTKTRLGKRDLAYIPTFS